MPQKALIYRILVASPSDCVHERRLIPDVIHAWNATHSLATRAILEPVLWETHALPEIGDRPQGLINKQLVDNCDILIGTFWTRLGTHTGKAESGTAEEIEEFRSSGRRVQLYFSSAPVVPESLDAEQYAALTAYKKRLGQDGLYFGYEDIGQLRSLLQTHIAGVMAQVHSQESPASPLSENEQKQEPIDVFVAQYQSFIRRLEAEWSSERDSDPYSTDLGKGILNSALDDVLSFRSQIIEGLSGVKATLDKSAKELRGLQRHQVFLDGGRSFREFWLQGDKIIDVLKTLPGLVSEEAARNDKEAEHPPQGNQ
jgi:hypothetical protein